MVSTQLLWLNSVSGLMKLPMSTHILFFQHTHVLGGAVETQSVWRFSPKRETNIETLMHQSYREVVLGRHPVLNSAICSDGDILE
jgi:hypothetical protein